MRGAMISSGADPAVSGLSAVSALLLFGTGPDHPKSRSGRALTFPHESTILRVSRKNGPSADVAQLAEHLICNQAVASSILAVSSVVRETGVGYPSGQRDQTVNLTAQAFEGSNPSPTMRREAVQQERGGSSRE